ncbi:hypothetical protein BJ085DRAFT_42590 [Dimargaris cristalligena]|uniref:C2H2-type domain-containing protein n=1 Tax=Dimargaris cristalligena TaxID=215637 RepID=A0A4P9ZVC4_9FUNG|nr:hypothetical protein BJ085DRAFT_42590 [Dimargaris cristalligena]|eukprot:RKP37523.1 hypothetical protein BJ085DRAFT_42590 [Dimargaris cristalligena]
MTRMRRKRNHHSIRDVKRQARTRCRTKDLDQIQEDLLPQNLAKFQAQAAAVSVKEEDADLPGGGRFYCVECSRHFVDPSTLLIHKKTREHRRRLKELAAGPAYTQKDAEAAAGLATDNGPGRLGPDEFDRS